MIRNFYVGVDGGATKCIVRVENDHGQLLGRETGKSATLRLPAAEVWDIILSTLHSILQQHSLSLHDDTSHFHAGIGLAGSEITANYHAFTNSPHPFKTCVVTSDAHTACLGAHNGADGAMVIAGTGVVGYQIQQGVTTKKGGFGFPHDDDGGGAWLGLQAVKQTVQWLDGRAPASGLAQAIYQRFNQDAGALAAWANAANGTLFAELAPIVIQQSEQKDSVAVAVLQQAAAAIEKIAKTLQQAQIPHSPLLPCALVGGIASFLQPYLSSDLQARLVSVAEPPDAGAIWLVKSSYSHERKVYA